MGQEEGEGDKSGGRPGRWRMQEGLGQKERQRIDDKRDKIKREPKDNFPRDGLAMHREAVHGICTRGRDSPAPGLAQKAQERELGRERQGSMHGDKGLRGRIMKHAKR